MKKLGTTVFCFLFFALGWWLDGIWLYRIEKLPNPDHTYDLQISCPNGHYPESMVRDNRLIVSCNN